MFQVLPERVMYATGAPKVTEKAKSTDEEAEAGEEEASEESDSGERELKEEAEEEVDVDRDPREVLKSLQAQAKSILSSTKQAALGAKRKQDLRAFNKTIRRLLSRSESSAILTASAETQFAEIQTQLRIRRENKEAGTSSLPSAQDTSSATSETESGLTAQTATTTAPEDETSLTDGEYNELLSALRSMNENPVDDSKPYATPWMPRDYMSAFAFIPRYLEVCHKICAAVYLRHPVARPGLSEVPSPFAEFTNSTAFAWYLRRR
jgi:hypothetical protein